MQRILFCLSTLSMLTLSSLTATTITVESGGITVNSYNTTTTGSQADPWLINETMTSAGTLRFAVETGSPLGTGNPTGSGHTHGRWISKTVTNGTNETWTSFELELESRLGTPSTEGDGLSFAQGFANFSTFSSDKFSVYTRQEITRDYLNFSGGTVNPGESVTFNFIITDNSANNPFWLDQIPNKSDVPEPSTYALIGTSILGLGLLRRRM